MGDNGNGDPAVSIDPGFDPEKESLSKSLYAAKHAFYSCVSYEKGQMQAYARLFAVLRALGAEFVDGEEGESDDDC